MNIRKRIHTQSNRTRTAGAIFVLFLAIIGLAGCGGGASTEPTQGGNPQLSGYTGTVTGDLHRGYALEVWPNLVPANRCGGACHVTGGTGKGAFVDNDIVVAFNAAVPALINTTNPAQSLLVERMRAGHNCWLASNDDCAAAMTRYIENMVGSTPTSGGGNSITLLAPTNPNKVPGGSKAFPATATSGSPTFEAAVYTPVLRPYCMSCHRENANPQTPQSPFIASDDVTAAYEAAKTKMNLDNPVASRLVQRMVTGHNVFDPLGTGTVNAADSAAAMEAAITAFANGISVTPPVLGTGASSAMQLADGQVASGGNRVDANVIAMWEFKEGAGNNVTNDRDGNIPLTLGGTEGTDYNWIGGNGIQLMNSSAQSALGATTGLFNQIAGPLGSNEYSIEAWVIPDNVADNNALIMTYGANRSTLNFALGQSMYNYDYLQADTNAVTEVSTPDADEEVQTTLQHVVLTYDAQNGRRIYVNGQLTAAPNGTGGNISGWSDQQFFILGGGETQWKGIIRLAVIHNRALQQQQIIQNYEAGVGEKSFLMFNVSNIIGNECFDNGDSATGNPMCYVYFEVSQFDTYSYLFNKPTFISLDANYTPSNIQLRGMRIGINGRLADTGQGFANLNMTIDGTGYTAGVGQVLSSIGSIIPLEKGAANDEFYLSFEALGPTNGTAFTEVVPSAPVLTDPAAVPEIGVRMFDEINLSMAQLTGVDPTTASIGGTNGVFTTYRQQLPASANVQTFLAAHQMAISQVAMTYCDELIKDTTKRSAYFPGFNFNRTTSELVLPVPAIPTDLGAAGNTTVLGIRNGFIEPLIEKMMNIDLADNTNNLTVQAAENDIRVELNDFVTRMTACGGSCDTPARTAEIVTATCAVALGNASMLVQ
jgi:hypothetical protein